MVLITITLTILKIRTKQFKPVISVNYNEKIDKLTKPKNYDPKDNAAPIARKAFDSLNDLDIPEYAFNEGVIKLEQVHPKRLKHVEQLIKSKHNALKQLHQAGQKPYYWRKCFYSSGVDKRDKSELSIMLLPKAITALIWRAKLHVENNNIPAAMADLTLAHKVYDYFELESRYSVDEFIKRITRNIVYTVQTNTVNADSLKAMQNDIESRDPGDFDKYLEIGRLIILDQIQNKFTYDGNGDGTLIPPKVPLTDVSSVKAFKDNIKYHKSAKAVSQTHDSRKVTIEKLNKSINLGKELSKLTPWEISKKNTRLYEAYLLKNMAPNRFLNSYLNSNYLYWNYFEMAAHREALISILAINRYNAEKGTFPASLQELKKKGYISTIPPDPYSDNSFVYKRTNKGFVLYSVGRDFKDNGGKYNEIECWDDTENGSDYVFWPIELKEHENEYNTQINEYFTDPDYVEKKI